MPPKRKRNNKKKKGSRFHNVGSSGKSKPPASASSQSSERAVEGDVPKEWLDWDRKASNSNLQTIYYRYKQATNRFMRYMMEACPDDVLGGRFDINSLPIAADHMEETQHALDPSVIRDLKLAIRMRTRVAKSFYGGGDAGHQHFLQVLTYCWTVLKELPSSPSAKADLQVPSEDEAVGPSKNSYAALMNADDDEETEDDEAMFPTTCERPKPDPKPLTLDELLNSDDRNDAIIFLLTLNELTASISDQYQIVTKNYKTYSNQKAPDSAIVETMLEAAVATNMAIQLVQQMEMELTLEHPHLTTPYRLLATLVLPEVTQNVATILEDHSSLDSQAKRNAHKEISNFLGDCIECYYRSLSDPFNKSDTLVTDFCRQWQVDSAGSAELDELFSGLEQISRLEVPIGPETQMNIQLQALYQSAGGQNPGSWIQNMPFIGGDRAIHHTLRLLQSFGSVVHDNTVKNPLSHRIVPRRGFFGKTPWRPGHARKIAGDLDELLMSDIMPSCIFMCRHGVLGKMDLPRQDELCPLFVAMQTYFDQPQKPVSWSITFAIHALLTAVLETDSIFNRLVMTSSAVFDKYFQQLDWAKMISNEEPDFRDGKVFQNNMQMLRFLKNLGLPVFGQRALWNPLCAGTVFSYLTFFGNVEAGCTLIDRNMQLRITLHLYHALLLNGIIRQGQLVFLDRLYAGFKRSKAIWEGSLPQKGEFVKRFWICLGSSISDAKQLAEQAKRDIRQRQSQPDIKSTNQNRTRKMSPLEPAQLFKTYRRICNRDYRDVVDKYHTPEQRRHNKGSVQYYHAVRTNDTLDAIYSEAKLLSFNFASSGAILEQFVCSLGRILQWEPFLAHDPAALVAGGAANTKRQIFANLFAQALLGVLDFADNPYGYQLLGVPLVEASASFMTQMFSRLNPGKVMWFQAIQEEEEEEEAQQQGS